VFFTKTPTNDATGAPASVNVQSFEHFEAGQDATAPGVCSPWDAPGMSVGVVTAVSDPVLATLALPLRIK
jgi:hypothetical protein